MTSREEHAGVGNLHQMDLGSVLRDLQFVKHFRCHHPIWSQPLSTGGERSFVFLHKQESSS